MINSINVMIKNINKILETNEISIFLYGSITLNDFRESWSDIDIICLTKNKITESQANKLLTLRQDLSVQYPTIPFFRLFEGAITTYDTFFNNIEDSVVYWGTSKERIINRYQLDPFAKIELIKHGILLQGNDFRDLLNYPSREEIVAAIRFHYETIRKHAVTTNDSIKSCGWLLDIARCIYTLRTNDIIAKTEAGIWAISNNIFPDIEIMKKVIEIRKNPSLYLNDAETKKWAATLGAPIQKFADILEVELRLS